MKNKVLRAIFIILGAIVLANALIVTVVANFNLGTVCAYVLSVLLILFGVFFTRIPKWICVAFPVLTVIGFSCIGALIIGGSIDTVTYNEDALIVLGAGIRGDKPAYALRVRLDKAVSYHEKNPDALIVVSGGQGPYESYTEAYVMEKYLISKGVDPSVIIKEERSTSTKENFAYSKEILDGMLDDGYSAAYVTNSFHIYRAGCYAKWAGLGSVTYIHGKTHPTTVLPDGMRECLAILKLWILE